MDKVDEVVRAVGLGLPRIKFSLNEEMKNYTSFKIGGSVRAMFFPGSADELASLCLLLADNDVEPLVMGNGTNLLVNDSALELIVINTSEMKSVELRDETEIIADAGINLSKLAVFAMEHGLSGLEFAHGIPGSLGGAVFMNAGAYGGEMKDVVWSTAAFDTDKGIKTISGDEHDFSYRHSRFSEKGETVLSAVLRLQKGDSGSIREKMNDLSVRRRESQPLDMPSAGSVFKRPAEGFAGLMVEQAGLKGYTVGGAQVSEKHAGFIVNKGGATYLDVMKVIEHVKKVIFKEFNIELELEIKIIKT